MQLSSTFAAFRGDVQDMRIIHTLDPRGPYNRIWMPFIAQWRPGHLVVAFGQHLRGKTDMGDIVCSISTDDGDTWDPPTLILDHRRVHGAQQFAYANPVLFRPSGQSILWCFAMRCPLSYPDSEDARLCAAYSIDGGRSWQEVELGLHFHSPLITCGDVVEWWQAGRPRYLLPVHRNSARHDPMGRCDQFVLESDNLLEWRLAGLVPQSEDQPVFMHEGNLALGEREGELKLVMRTAEFPYGHAAIEPPVAYSSVSQDGGRTWSSGQPEPALYNSVSKAYYGADGFGGHVYVYSPGPAWERLDLSYCHQDAAGAWSAPRPFFAAGVHNSYPTLLLEQPGQFYAVWDSSHNADQHRTAIRFGKLVLA